MKKNMKLGSTLAFAILIALTSCGKSGGGGDNQTATDRATAQCNGNQQCIQQVLANGYGPNGVNGSGYYNGQTYCGNGISGMCGSYTTPYFNQGCTSSYGCSGVRYLYVPANGAPPYYLN